MRPLVGTTEILPGVGRRWYSSAASLSCSSMMFSPDFSFGTAPFAEEDARTTATLKVSRRLGFACVAHAHKKGPRR